MVRSARWGHLLRLLLAVLQVGLSTSLACKPASIRRRHPIRVDTARLCRSTCHGRSLPSALTPSPQQDSRSTGNSIRYLLRRKGAPPRPMGVWPVHGGVGVRFSTELESATARTCQLDERCLVRASPPTQADPQLRQTDACVMDRAVATMSDRLRTERSSIRPQESRCD